MRVLPSGPKCLHSPATGRTAVASAFDCTPPDTQQRQMSCTFEAGITRSHFTRWTMAGLSEASAISSAFGVTKPGVTGGESAALKKELIEWETVETVYSGYSDNNRICFPGDHNLDQQLTSASSNNRMGKMEHKSKLASMDIALPSAPYDLRLTLSTERNLASNVKDVPRGWKTRRLKRRRSYRRKDGHFAWQLDITEVTTSSSLDTGGGGSETLFEIETELNSRTTLQLINETDQTKVRNLCNQLAQQLWWMLGQINAMGDILDVEEFLREHPNRHAVQLALGQCGALKSFMDSKRHGGSEKMWSTVIHEDGKSPTPSPKLCNIKFPGCMPVNFSRHNIEEVQRCDSTKNGSGGGYFLSEKTDGVRYFMVFTGSTVVLVDRRMNGKQPIMPNSSKEEDPMSKILPLIKPGTVFDGEVVMHRKLRRPIYIVFDVLCISSTQPILHLPFRTRLKHLKQATFHTKAASRDIFAQEEAALRNMNIVLPLVRKNFVMRTELDGLLGKVFEEKGVRSYRSCGIHNHLTDGIIFQPDKPYVCGTDVRLLKWKYLDTVTIDVQILPHDSSSFRDNKEDILNVGVLGEEGTLVNMTRFIQLPGSERQRLEADRNETKANIAEVGLDPSTGEWYYSTMRPDKNAPNHISTVLGSLMELAENLGTEELRYRMNVQPGTRDTYRKDMRKMQKQLLQHQMEMNKTRK